MKTLVFTVRELLHRYPLSSAHLLGGGDGLDREVTSASLLEAPDFHSERHPYELIFTTGYPFKDREEIQLQLMRDFGAHDISGLVIKVPRFLSVVPEPMRILADQYRLPLLQVGADANLNQMVYTIIETIFSQRQQVLNQLLDIVAHDDAGDPREIWEQSATILMEEEGVRVLLTTEDGVVLPLLTMNIAHQIGTQRISWRPNRTASSNEMIIKIGGEVFVGLVNHIPGSGDNPSAYLLLYQKSRQGSLVIDAEWHPFLMFFTGLAKRCLRAMWGARMDIATSLGRSDPAELLRQCGLSIQEGAQWVITSPQKDTKQIWRRLEGMRMKMGVVGCTFFDANRLYFLGPPLLHLHEGFLANFVALLPDGSTLGYGPVCYESEQLWDTLKRTDNILTLHGDTGGLIDCTTVGLELVLGHVPVPVQKAFVDGVLGALIQYDRDHHTDLMETLAAYLDEGSVKSTASRLQIHYNTVSYRLRQIEDILSCSLTSHTGRQRIGLAYTFMLAARHPALPSWPAPYTLIDD